MVKCKNLVFCTCKVEIYNLIYPVLLRGYYYMTIGDYKKMTELKDTILDINHS
ncbi:hypothetical protein MSIBF_A2940002 [groundwater metagenome]|uniref:Uncharacterized protein n=1 Tax=groundwater metagenome TaxID=717931 RepID=A0A098EAA7_9ZZZZ